MSLHVTPRHRKSHSEPRAKFVAALAAMTLVAAGLAAISAASVAEASPPKISCTTDAHVFNTGYDSADGGVFAAGHQDANWQVTSVPSLGAGTVELPPASAAWSSANVIARDPNWVASPFNNAEWIAQTSPSPVNEDFYFRYDFSLSNDVSPGNFNLQISFFADNYVAGVFVNGTSYSSSVPQLAPGVDPYNYGGYTKEHEASMALDSGWKTGANSIVVQIKNKGPHGFDAQVGASVLCVPSLTTQKSLKSVNGLSATAATVIKGGDVLDYQLVTTNSGDLSGQNDIHDVVPKSTTYSGTNEGWSCDSPAAGSDCVQTVVVAGHGTVTKLYTVTVMSALPATTTSIVNVATGASCTELHSQCSPNGNPVVNPGKLSTTATIFTVNDTSATSATPVSANDVLVYKIETRNTGGLASSVDLTETVPLNTRYSGSGEGWSCGSTEAAASCTGSVNVLPGAAEIRYFTVTVSSPLAAAVQHISNAVSATSCSGDSCAPPANPVKSYSVVITSDAPTVNAGGTVHYTVTVTNTGSFAYTASMSAGFDNDLATLLQSGQYIAGGGDAALTGHNLAWSGPLMLAQVKVFTYAVQVNNPLAGDHRLANAVTTAVDGGCSASAPSAPCNSLVKVASFSVGEVVDKIQVRPGGTFTYTITVTNTGAVDFTAQTPARFSNNLAAVLDDADFVGSDDPRLVLSGTTLNWAGAVSMGTPVVIRYTVSVRSPNHGDNRLSTGIVAAPEGGCFADGTSDPIQLATCSRVSLVQSYTVRTVTDRSSARPGGTLRYVITLINDGLVDYTDSEPASFSNEIAAELDDAEVNEDLVGTLTLDGAVMSWSGPIAVGESVTLGYSVTIKKPGSGDGALRGALTPQAGGRCAEAELNLVCLIGTPIQSFGTTMAVNSSSVVAGETLKYTITLANSSDVNYTAENPASFVVSLVDALKRAHYEGDLTSGAELRDGVISWSGELGAQQPVVVTFSLTTLAFSGSQQILAAGVETGLDGGCGPAESPVLSEPQCRVATTVTALPLPVVSG